MTWSSCPQRKGEVTPRCFVLVRNPLSGAQSRNVQERIAHHAEAPSPAARPRTGGHALPPSPLCHETTDERTSAAGWVAGCGEMKLAWPPRPHVPNWPRWCEERGTRNAVSELVPLPPSPQPRPLGTFFISEAFALHTSQTWGSSPRNRHPSSHPCMHLPRAAAGRCLIRVRCARPVATQRRGCALPAAAQD